MKISELIEQLVEIGNEHGDLPVYVPQFADDWGDTCEADCAEFCADTLGKFGTQKPDRVYIS